MRSGTQSAEPAARSTNGRGEPALPSFSLAVGRDPAAGGESDAMVAPSLASAPGPGGLVTDDETETLTAGQMRKTPFLAELRRVACEVADRELRRVGRTADGCPYIGQILARFARRPAAAVERALRRYAPDARGATRAADYLEPVAARLGQGVAAWVSTGRMPENVPDEARGGGLAGLGGIAGLFFQGVDGGGGRTGVDPAALAGQLGAGRPLEGGVRGRMESALGHPFGDVRIHVDEHAAGLSRELEARAFTLGPHIAFGAGEFRPGEPVGDALLAHELAHVVQQRGAAPGGEVARGGDHDVFERDADTAAVSAMTALYGGEPRRRGSRWSGGLRLQRCAARQQVPVVSAATAEDAARIIAMAQDTSRVIEERAVAVVRAILDAYYPGDRELVRDIRYVADEPGLSVTSVGQGAETLGDLEVGRYYTENTNEVQLGRRILQLGHELQHIRQYRSGMTGPARQDEREFLAHHWAAMAPDPPGARSLQHAMRVRMIDTALGYYSCLSAGKQTEHRSRRDELVEARQRHQSQSGRADTGPPAGCARP
jgi:hypothetical protein